MNELSAIDLKILGILQSEGDISNVQLAEKVSLSTSACLQRVRRLRGAGYICGVAALLDLKKISSHVVVRCSIRLSEQTTRYYSHFEAAIQKIPEIVECGMISGDYDYLLKFVVRDMQHFNDILTMMLEMNIGIKNHASVVELKSVKHLNRNAVDQSSKIVRCRHIFTRCIVRELRVKKATQRPRSCFAMRVGECRRPTTPDDSA